MKIIDILKNASIILGKTNLSGYLTRAENNTLSSNEDSEVCAEVNKLVDLSNLVIGELSATYIPLIIEESITPTNNKITFSTLTKSISKVEKVLDAEGNEMFFILHPTYVEVDDSAKKIVYRYIPYRLGLLDTVGYTDKDISARELADGVVAEYCVSLSMFSEALSFRDRYEKSIEKRVVPKCKKLKERSFK